MVSADCLEWLKYASMDIDSSQAARGLNSAKRIYDFVSEQLGLKKVYFA